MERSVKKKKVLEVWIILLSNEKKNLNLLGLWSDENDLH